MTNNALATIGAGMVLTQNSKVLLVRLNYGKGKDQWILPGGLVHENESPEQGAIREVFEETGLECTSTGLICIRYRLNEKSQQNVYWVFNGSLKENQVKHKFNFDKEEIQEVKFWDIQSAIESKDVRPMTQYFLKEYLKRETIKQSINYLGDFIYK